MRQVIIYPGEDGYWVAECPSLPGCISQGETKLAALANIKEAIKGIGSWNFACDYPAGRLECK
jgi:predicted RNase H-like HicB family nuclease